MERPSVLSPENINTNTNTKFETTSLEMAVAAAPLEPRDGSLAWFMLSRGTLTVLQQLPSSSTTTSNYTILPLNIRDLDFDLRAEVHSFAMNYNNIPIIPNGYDDRVQRRRYTHTETNLKTFLYNTLWKDVDTCFRAADDLPYELDPTDYSHGEDARVRKIIPDVDEFFGPKVVIIEVKTASSLTNEQMHRLRNQQPWQADPHNQHILAQLLHYFRRAEVNWGVITNGNASIFIQYQSHTRDFLMSDIIEHSAPDIVGCYCWLARHGDQGPTDHPPLQSGTPIIQSSSADALSPLPTTVYSSSVLEASTLSDGNFANTSDGSLSKQKGAAVPIIAKVSYATEESNSHVIREIELYYRLRELWGNVLPALYGAGPHKIEGEFSGAYALVLERLDAVEHWDAETRMQAKQAIQELHRRGIVHGDIRRDNFRWRRETGRVVVIDLGNAHAGNDEEMEEELKFVDELSSD